MQALIGLMMVIFFIGIFLGIPIARRFDKYIKVNHPEIWESIGTRPSLDQTSRNTLQYLAFIFKRKDKVMRDSELSRLTRKIYWYHVIMVSIFIINSILFFVGRNHNIQDKKDKIGRYLINKSNLRLVAGDKSERVMKEKQKPKQKPGHP